MASTPNPTTRLTRALKLLELARTSRTLAYAATPYVMAAELLINKAMDECGRDKSNDKVY